MAVINEALQFRLHWEYPSFGPAINVFGLSVDPPGGVVTQATADTIATDVTTALTSSGLLTWISSQTRLVRVDVRDLRTENLPLFESTLGLPVAGAATGDAMPSELAIVVTLRTALAGRSFRGRTYLGGLGENAGAADGTPAATATADADDFVTALHANLQASDPDWNGLGVISRFSNGAERNPGIITPVTAVVRRGGVGWQVQRRRGSASG